MGKQMSMAGIFKRKPKDHSYSGDMSTPTKIKVSNKFFKAIEEAERNPRPSEALKRTMAMDISDIKL